MWSPLLQGRTVVVVPTRSTQNVEQFIDILEEFGIQRLYLVTTLLRNILSVLSLHEKAERRLTQLKTWEVTGENVGRDVALAFFDYFQDGQTFSNFYGATEMMDTIIYECFCSRQDVLDKSFNGKIPIGRPIDNNWAMITNERLHQVNEGEMGILYVSGHGLADGYISAKAGGGFIWDPVGPVLSRFKTVYKTGDYVTISNGRLYFEGRLDSQLKVGFVYKLSSQV